MKQLARPFAFAALVQTFLALAAPRCADGHGGGILIQAVNDRVTTNFDNESGTQVLDARSFSLLFPPTSQGGNNGASDSPSFISLATPPAGTSALPEGVDVYLDFLPMTIGGVTSNLFYWDANGASVADVHFSPVPDPSATFSLYDESFMPTTIDGEAKMAGGLLLGTTDASGSGLRLHAHRFFFLDDNDGDESTSPPDGIYLATMQLRIPGLRNSKPFSIVAGTFGTTIESLDSAALPWAADYIDEIIIAGDFNFSGGVDGGDFLAWQRQFGSTGPFPDDAYADADGDGIVGAGDLAVWMSRFGAPMPAGSVATVPEPTSCYLLAAALGAALCIRRRRSRTQALPTSPAAAP